MTQTSAASYDELPYASNAFAQTHPDRMHVIGRLFGMHPALPSRSRVLEIGCASGGNLIPMALQMPDASFVGIDLSARQIEAGNAMLARTGVRNVELRQFDLMNVDASFGQFDYIVIHGVYSWVPRAAQDKLLAICKERLAPQGIAYVSYNTFPGWHLRGMVRDMMVYHAQRFSDLTMKVPQARALLGFLAENVPTENNPYGLALKQEVETLRQSSDSYLAHEFLEEHNEPLYFHQFAERAVGVGLQYLGEAEFHSMLASNFPKTVSDTLNAIAPEIIPLEQYMDFLRNRVFRQSLLVHNSVVLSRSVTWQAVEPFLVSSPLRAEAGADADVTSTAAVKFTNGRGAGITTSLPIVKAALTTLAESFPQAIPFTDLQRIARERVAAAGRPDAVASPAQDAELLGSDILSCYAAGIVELRAEAPPLVTAVGERPQADTFARLQATAGRQVTNRRHEIVALDELSRQLLPHLDGTADHAALLETMTRIAQTDALQVRKGTEPIRDPQTIRTVLDQALRESYLRLAASGLLVA